MIVELKKGKFKPVQLSNIGVGVVEVKSFYGGGPMDKRSEMMLQKGLLQAFRGFLGIW